MKRIYDHLLNWTDRQWASVGDWRKLLVPTIALALAGFPFKAARSLADISVLALLLGAAVIWQFFVFWRAWHYAKSVSREAGQHYEEKGRHRLPSEYADSEDAMMAAERRSQSTPPPR